MTKCKTRVIVCLSIYLTIYKSICLYRAICLSVYLSIYLSIYLYIYLYIFLSIGLSIFLSFYISVYLSICLPTYLYLSIYPSYVYLFIFLSKLARHIFLCYEIYILLSIFWVSFTTPILAISRYIYHILFSSLYALLSWLILPLLFHSFLLFSLIFSFFSIPSWRIPWI